MRRLAHGIGEVRDLPVPASFFFMGATIVLVVSFILLGALWRRPELEAHAGVVAHGGFAGAVVESLVVLAVVALLVAVWLREQRAPRRHEASESLSDDERTPS